MIKNLKQKTASFALIAASVFTPVYAADSNQIDIEELAGGLFSQPSLNCTLLKREEADTSYQNGKSISIEYECRPIIRMMGKSFSLIDFVVESCKADNLLTRIIKITGKSPLNNGKPTIPLEEIMYGCTIFVNQDGVFDSYAIKTDDLFSTTQEYRDFNRIRLFQTFKSGSKEVSYKTTIIFPSGDFI